MSNSNAMAAGLVFDFNFTQTSLSQNSSCQGLTTQGWSPGQQNRGFQHPVYAPYYINPASAAQQHNVWGRGLTGQNPPSLHQPGSYQSQIYTSTNTNQSFLVQQENTLSGDLRAQDSLSLQQYRGFQSHLYAQNYAGQTFSIQQQQAQNQHPAVQQYEAYIQSSNLRITAQGAPLQSLGGTRLQGLSPAQEYVHSPHLRMAPQNVASRIPAAQKPTPPQHEPIVISDGEEEDSERSPQKFSSTTTPEELFVPRCRTVLPPWLISLASEGEQKALRPTTPTVKPSQARRKMREQQREYEGRKGMSIPISVEHKQKHDQGPKLQSKGQKKKKKKEKKTTGSRASNEPKKKRKYDEERFTQKRDSSKGDQIGLVEPPMVRQVQQESFTGLHLANVAVTPAHIGEASTSRSGLSTSRETPMPRLSTEPSKSVVIAAVAPESSQSLEDTLLLVLDEHVETNANEQEQRHKQEPTRDTVTN